MNIARAERHGVTFHRDAQIFPLLAQRHKEFAALLSLIESVPFPE